MIKTNAVSSQRGLKPYLIIGFAFIVVFCITFTVGYALFDDQNITDDSFRTSADLRRSLVGAAATLPLFVKGQWIPSGFSLEVTADATPIEVLQKLSNLMGPDFITARKVLWMGNQLLNADRSLVEQGVCAEAELQLKWATNAFGKPVNVEWKDFELMFSLCNPDGSIKAGYPQKCKYVKEPKTDGITTEVLWEFRDESGDLGTFKVHSGESPAIDDLVPDKLYHYQYASGMDFTYVKFSKVI